MSINVQELIDKLANAISFKFKEDGTSPGLTISKLRNGYYCSVVRYPSGGAASTKTKVIVCKAQASSLEAAVQEVAKRFVETNKSQPDPLQALNEAVKDL
jgi:hypothetical protein